MPPEPGATTRHVKLAQPAEAGAAPARDQPADVDRVATRGHSPDVRAARKRVKILFFAANIPSGDRLALDREFRAIEQSIHAARHRDIFQLIPKFAAQVGDLQQALLEHRPDVVHFACHGSAQAELFLLTEAAEAAPVPADALVSMFRVLRDNLALVVLNACFASEQASAIRQSVGLSIGMSQRVEDRVAITFASALYGALAYGRSVREAFELGRAAIAASGSRQSQVPQLFAATGVDARTVYLVRRDWRRIAVVAFLVAALCASLGLGWWLHRKPEPPRSSPPDPRMVRFSAADIQLGVFSPASRPQVCSSLGADEDCAERGNPEKVAVTHLEAFDLDRDEVTNREFADWLNSWAEMWKPGTEGVIETVGAAIPLASTAEACAGLTMADGRIRAAAERARWPVVCVTWQGASEYCRAHGKRLPLEAEWELAAKGPEGRPFPWGAAMPRPDGVAFGLRDSPEAHPREVGASFEDVSPQGLHDLGGNVAEWVDSDRARKGEKTFRGGSWASTGPCRLLGSGCKHRPDENYGLDLGFRCASSVMNGNLEGRKVR